MTKLFCNPNDQRCIQSRDWGLLLLRITVGVFMLVFHGLPKLQNYAELSQTFPPMLGMSSQVALSLIIFAEVFMSIALILGLLTRLATIPLIIGLGVASFVAHAGDPIADREMSLLYFFLYVVILLTGPGKISLDSLIYKRFCPHGKKPNEGLTA